MIGDYVGSVHCQLSDSTYYRQRGTRRGSCLIYVQCAVKYTEEDHASSFTRFLFALTGELPLNRDWKTYIH